MKANQDLVPLGVCQRPRDLFDVEQVILWSDMSSWIPAAFWWVRLKSTEVGLEAEVKGFGGRGSGVA